MATAVSSNGSVEAYGEIITNDAAESILSGAPYQATVEIRGDVPLFFHRWSVEAIEEKAKAAKGSADKKSDNIESYVYRLPDGKIGLPGEYVRQAVIWAAKYRQDPRSPRKSAMDLFKAAVVSLTELAVIKAANGMEADTWDYLDRRRVVVQRNGITRTRPAFNAGWRAEVTFLVTQPNYISPDVLHAVLTQAGQFVGVGDNRPSYGRFQVVRFEHS